MRVLIIPQYSMRSLVDDRWLLDRDGHMDFCLSIVKGLQRIEPELLCSIIIPTFCVDPRYMLELYGITGRQVEFISKPAGPNVHLERSNFDLAWWTDFLLEHSFDVVINNNESFARGLRGIREYYGLSYRLHALYEHVPIFSGTRASTWQTSWYRLLESGACSDRHFTLLPDVAPVLEFFLNLKVAVVPFADPAWRLPAYGGDNKEQRSLFVPLRLTEPARFSTDQVQAVLRFANANSLRLTVSNPDESQQVPDSLKPYIQTIDHKSRYFTELQRAIAVPVFVDTRVILSVTYIQAGMNECYTELDQIPSASALKSKADQLSELYSWEYNKRDLAVLLE